MARGNAIDERREWVIDSGASYHSTGDAHWFGPGTLKNSSNSITIVIADGTEIISEKSGMVKFNYRYGNQTEEMTLSEVRFLPGSAANIISVGKDEGKGNQFTFRNGRCVVTDGDGDDLINTHKSGDVSKIRAYGLGSLNVASSKISKAELWHQRLNHPGKSVMQAMVSKQIINDFPADFKTSDLDFICHDCPRGK